MKVRNCVAIFHLKLFLQSRQEIGQRKQQMKFERILVSCM